MAAGKEKVFLGRSQTMKTAFGEFKKTSFGPDDLKKMNDFAATNNGWCNILIKEKKGATPGEAGFYSCLLYTSPSPRDLSTSRMPSSA